MKVHVTVSDPVAVGVAAAVKMRLAEWRPIAEDADRRPGADLRSGGHSVQWRSLRIRRLLPGHVSQLSSSCQPHGMPPCLLFLSLSLVSLSFWFPLPPTMYTVAFADLFSQTTGGGTVRFNPNLYNCGKGTYTDALCSPSLSSSNAHPLSSFVGPLTWASVPVSARHVVRRGGRELEQGHVHVPAGPRLDPIPHHGTAPLSLSGSHTQTQSQT
jgi:hypothetical protein